MRRVDRVGPEHLRRAEEGVHGPLRVGRDQDQAARGGADAGLRRRVELDPEAADVVREDLPELVVGELADEARREARARRGPATVLAADPPLASRAGPIAS